MTYKNVRWLAVVAASIVATTLAGCDDDAKTVPAAQSVAADVPFSVFANQAFSNSANSTPVAVNGVTFTYDVNDQPTYFGGLIAMGSFQ